MATETTAVPNAPRRATWVIWLALGLIGVVMATTGVWSSQQTHRAQAHRAAALSALRVQVSAAALAAQQALMGDEAGVAHWADARAKAQDQWTALSKGSVTVSALPASDQAPLAAAWNGLQPVWDSVQDAMRGLTSADQALAQLPALAQGLAQTKAELLRQSSLSAWVTALAPVQADVDRADRVTLEAVFAPGAAQATAQQWAAVLQQRATDADRLLASAAQDTTLNSTARRALTDWGAQVHRLAQLTQTLAASVPYRTLVQQAQGPLLQRTLAWDQAAAPTHQALVQAQDAASGMDGLAALGGLMAGVGLLGAGLAARGQAQQAQQWAAAWEQQQALADHVERLTRRVRRWAEQGIVGEALEEDPSSPTHALSSWLSRWIQHQQKALDEWKERAQRQAAAWTTQSQLWRQVAQAARATPGADQAQRLAQSMAEIAAQLTQAQQQVGQWHASSAHVQGRLEEGLLRADGLRETIQNSSKRLKRLGESSQNMGSGTQMLHDLAQRIQVLAVTGVIEAATAGEQGRSLAALAREIEDLAKNAGLVAQDVDRLLDELRKDAHETVTAMEHSTAEVVASSRLVHEANEVLKRMDHEAQGQRDERRQQVAVVEEQAVVAHRLQQEWDEQTQRLGQVRQWSAEATTRLDALTSEGARPSA